MAESGTAHKISYCTTCKGRTHHLKQTLRANMDMEAGNPNVEFVVLDYDSRDGLQKWIRENFADELKCGRLRYGYHGPAEHFHFAHAKNLSHRLATGDILCNLDADNFLAPGFSQWLDKKFTQQPHSVVTPQLLTAPDLVTNTILRFTVAQRRAKFGMAGRLALHRDDFQRLGGYDERIEGHDGDDLNLAKRARDAGLKCVATPPSLYGDVIRHDTDLRIAELAPEVQAYSKSRLDRSRPEKVLFTMRDRLRKAPALPEGVQHGLGEINAMPESNVVHILEGLNEPSRQWRESVRSTPDTEPLAGPSL